MADSAPSSIAIETVSGAALAPFLGDLARLRITVFRAFPYLYEGEEGYERRYLETYVKTPHAAVILARADEGKGGAKDGRIIGAATCLPLAAETDNVQAPFRARGLDPARFFYFGESVLLAEYRGRGIGVAFFAAREAHARRVSKADFATFCAVQRPPDHPARPAGYVPLDTFWRHRGFVPRPDLTCTMRWRDLGATEESAHRLGFWMKSLTGAQLP